MSLSKSRSMLYLRPLLVLQCVALLLLGVTPAYASDPVIVPEAASGFRDSPTVYAKSAMAVTANPYASEAAVKILRQGGSAIDAGIAAQLVLGLVEPQSSGIGGGAFMLHWDAKHNQLSSWDGRETAPQAIDDRYFLNADGSEMGFFEAVIGGHSVGVPGVVAMLEAAHREFGKLPWTNLFTPAIELAEAGFIISPRLHTLLKEMPKVAVNPAISAYFFDEQLQPKAIGSRLANPAYAQTLRLLAKEGSHAFYRGAIAHDIVAAVAKDPNRAGRLSLADLKQYHAVRRPAVCAPFRVYQVCGAPPPSSGGTTVLAILGMLDAFEARSGALKGAGFMHGFIEASRLAFADRNRYVADPDFVAVPSAGLFDSHYLKQRADLIQNTRLAVVEAGVPPDAPKRSDSRSPELPSTSHFSIVDADGNVMSMTTSIETAFGSRVFVGGFLLNNQLTDFSFSPKDADGSKIANRIQPGKRPRSSMSPMIVFKNNRPVLAIGSPGGARIIDYVAGSLYHVLAEGDTISAAIARGHIVAMGDTLELESGRFKTGDKKQLNKLGHQFRERDQTSGLHGIVIKKSGLEGAADPRREGQALGF
ncbi:MAG: gamma-glutamyltransferase [Zhongshania sp.]|uniref:gamma-glutamyltransferase n=1 Tax=Zhongshania sp. TaxID=1971902 RepID=UPI00260D7A9F|nr:gamma-glutamyltransferase [Zhongshania sp.]MDF1693270.1 gamma-glutamyltransferase [Zhongshania sp.]